MTHYQANTTFEVEVAVEGIYYPGYPMTRDDPGCDGEVDGLDIATVSMLRHEYDRVTGKFKYTPVDLLDGVDKAARDRIAANILAFLGEEAEELIVAEARS